MHSSTTAVAPDYALVIFALIGVGAIVAGVAIWRHAEAVAGFFRGIGQPMLGQRASAKTYTGRNMKWAGGGYVVVGVIFIVVAVAVLIARQA